MNPTTPCWHIQVGLFGLQLCWPSEHLQAQDTQCEVQWR